MLDGGKKGLRVGVVLLRGSGGARQYLTPLPSGGRSSPPTEERLPQIDRRASKSTIEEWSPWVAGYQKIVNSPKEIFAIEQCSYLVHIHFQEGPEGAHKVESLPNENFLRARLRRVQLLPP